jgi:GNAT superfamily N-acetyltransferase
MGVEACHTLEVLGFVDEAGDEKPHAPGRADDGDGSCHPANVPSPPPYAGWMLSWRELRVDHPFANGLLTEYFESRAAGFPVHQGTYRTTFPVPGDFVAPRGVFLVALDENDESAENSDGSRHLGCGGIRLLEANGPAGPRFEVKHLYLRPVARRHGLGRALLLELELRARELGAAELVLDTNAILEAAGSLYRSSGYSDIRAYNDNPNATNWYRKVL